MSDADYDNIQTTPIDSNSSIDWLKEVQMVEILSYRHKIERQGYGEVLV